MIFDKEIWYDWNGGNEALFRLINSFSGDDSYDKVMILLSRLAEPRNFPYYFAAFALWAFGTYALRKISGNSGTASARLGLWIAVLAVLVVGYGADVALIKTFKHVFAYPRPYIVFDAKDIHVLEYKYQPENDHMTFPSGHAAFITLLAFSLWPLLGFAGRWGAALLVIAVCWSRLAMGMHFPADVLGGFLIMFVAMQFVSAIVYRVLRHLHVKC